MTGLFSTRALPIFPSEMSLERMLLIFLFLFIILASENKHIAAQEIEWVDFSLPPDAGGSRITLLSVFDNNNSIYATTYGVSIQRPGAGYMSDLSAENWRKLSRTFYLMIERGHELVAASSFYVYLSGDLGERWTNVYKANYISGNPVPIILELFHSSRNILLASGPYSDKVRSTDLGRSWARASERDHSHHTSFSDGTIFRCVAFDPGNSEYGRLYRSEDDALIWDQISTFTEDGYNPCDQILAGPGDRLLVTSRRRIFLSTDRGMEFRRVGEQLQFSTLANFYIKLPVVFTSGGKLIAGTEQGIWVSEDDGGSWLPGGLQSSLVTSLAVTEDDFIFASTIDSSSIPRVYKSSVPVDIGVGVSNEKIQEVSLEGRISNYPNPFRTNTTIEYNHLYSGNAKIELYSITGTLVRTLHSGFLTKGKHKFHLSSEGLPSGVYIYEITSGYNRLSGKAVVTK